MSKNKKIEAIYQLSPLQRGILFHTAYAPESGMYFEQVLLEIEGDLNTAMFDRAWQETATQDILRTLFIWEGQDKPLQVVVEQVKLPFAQHDWRDLTEPEQRARLKTFLADDRRRGFDLTKPPLMRLLLIRVADQRYQLVLSFHHLLLDGWSMWLLLGEVFSRYEAAGKNEPFKLEKLLSYGDYIDWLQKQDLSAAEEYWRQTLAGFSTPTRLRVERGFTASAEADYLEEELRLPEETTTSLLSFARQNKLTISTLVQGAWALMLSRWSGEQDVVYGVVVSGRPASLSGAESIVGLFINSLPMRAQLQWNDSVVSWLRSLQDQMAEMSQYEYSPLVDIQGWTGVPRGVQLFDTLFAFENYPMEASSLGDTAGLKVQFTQAVEKTNYPITVVAVPGAGLTLKIIYHSGRFDKEIVSRLLGGLEAMLDGMTVNPDSRLRELPYLPAAERNLLADWNDTQKPRIYVLDAQMQPVPIGMVGEIYIAGEGLALGDLNRPELTPETLLPDPFSEGKLYRTGDVGRYLRNGNLEYLGRADQQLKIRGYRIEPGEIEAVLQRHPEVRQAVVVAATQAERLVAYVVGEAGAQVEVERIREYLAERLPDYMVPGLIVAKEELPVTSNGKVDRQLLSDWEHTRVEERSEHEAPRTKVEKKIAEIWEEVLGVQRVGLHDSFFELGGHSIQVMRVASRIYKAFNVELSLHDFFKAATVADLGMAIVLKHTESQDSEKVMQALAGLE
jgi:acyl-CoA synthetase (AMP-forming)/AMP-acid ligase II/acyl carrier protein